MCLEADQTSISVTFQRLKLSHPINGPGADSGPLVAVSDLSNIFAMAMADSLFGEEAITVWIRCFPCHGRVTRIPIEHEGARRHCRECSRGLCGGCCVAGKFIFKYKSDAALASFFSGLVQGLVHRLAVWRRVVESPEIKTAHQARSENPCQRDAALQDFSLLIEAEICVELITFHAEP